jgi:hypothetical protein
MTDEEKPILYVEALIDNSGSMQSSKSQVVDGVNRFINELATGIIPAVVGVTLYDDNLRRSLIDRVSVADLPQLRHSQYEPMHGTENIAECVIQGLEKRMATFDAHKKVLVMMTDGQNTSPQMAKARALVAKRRAEGWLILWLGIYPDHKDSHGHERGKEYNRHYQRALVTYAKELGLPDDVIFALPHTVFAEAMPLAAKAALRFVGSKGGKAGTFTPEERARINQL